MREEWAINRDRKPVQSFLLIFVIVAAGLTIMLPLTVPKVSAQVTHLGSTSAEDGVAPYDVTGPGDFLVYWDGTETHIMNQNYVVNSGYELRIPALNPLASPSTTIEIQFPLNITVQPGARLTFETDGPFNPLTQFVAMVPIWDGIYFASGSEGLIQDVEINGAITAITFSPGSTILSPGIELTTVQGFANYGIYMDGAVGYTNIQNGVNIYDTANTGTGVFVSNGMLNLSGGQIQGHGSGKPNLHIKNAIVTSTNNWFDSDNQPGNCILVDDSPGPDSTVVTYPIFTNGASDNYYVKGRGGSPLIINGMFDEANNANAAHAVTSISAQDSHITLLNPGDGSPFNSTRVNASFGGASTVTINWYVDVYVDDPDGNAVPNALVDLEAPSWPDTMLTDAGGDMGWARGFVVTEKVVHYSTIDNYNPLNASAENNTMYGYADPEPTIDTNTDVFITVPFNPIPNTLPTVTFEPPLLSGVYTGLISFDFTVTDPDPGDDGFLEVDVLYYDDSMGWTIAEPDVSSDPITGLSSGVTYTFVWDSRHPNNMENSFSSNVQIWIIPRDKLGTGTDDLSGIFTVDNLGPIVLTGPNTTPSDTSCIIEWTTDEASTSEVWYGVYGDGTVNDLTTEVETLTLNTTPVLSLSSLLSGRRYTYVINSTDNMGNKYSSAPLTFTFDTILSIQLYTGWNMISIPHLLLDMPLHLVLGSIAGDWDIAMSYDSLDPNDPWKTNYTGKPYHMNDLHDYFTHMALWLHVTTDTVLTPNYMYDKDLSPTTLNIELVEGWNFVGYYSVEPRDINDALSSISVSYDMVEHYDAENDLWLTYDGAFGLLDKMEPTKGYWIHMTQADTWIVDYE